MLSNSTLPSFPRSVILLLVASPTLLVILFLTVFHPDFDKSQNHFPATHVSNFENMDDLIYELHDDFISGIGDIYKKDLRAACHPVSQSTLMAVSEYIHSNQSLIQFLLHQEGVDLFMKRTYLRNIKFITQFFKLNGIDISQQKKPQLKIIIFGSC